MRSQSRKSLKAGPNQVWSWGVAERISKGRKQPLVHHADNVNAMRAATLESRLEELGVLRSFSRPRVTPSARKVGASPSRPLFPPGGLMEQNNAPLQRGRQS